MEKLNNTGQPACVEQGSYQCLGSAQFASLMEQEISSATTFAEARASYMAALACVQQAHSQTSPDHHRLNAALTEMLGNYKHNAKRLYEAGCNPCLN